MGGFTGALTTVFFDTGFSSSDEESSELEDCFAGAFVFGVGSKGYSISNCIKIFKTMLFIQYLMTCYSILINFNQINDWIFYIFLLTQKKIVYWDERSLRAPINLRKIDEAWLQPCHIIHHF